MIRISRKTYYIDGANKSKKKSTPGPDPMLLPFVTILRLAALHIESGVVWCRNGVSNIREKGNNEMKNEINEKREKKKKRKENKSKLKIKTSIRLSFFFSSLSTPAGLGHNGHCAPISAAVLLLSGRC